MVCVCFLGSNDTFRLFGNKGTESDIGFRNYKKERETITFVTPLTNKARTLIQAVNMSNFVVVEINEINKLLGEIILLLSFLNKEGMFIVRSEKQHLIESAKEIAKGMLDYDFRVINDNKDIKELREFLMSLKIPFGKDALIVIDHYFNIKGTGTVALGFVKGGVINAKDKFTLLPKNKPVQINSIQSMDINYKKIDWPARIGVSLKNCSLGDLERGSVLSNTLKEVMEIKGEISISPFVKRELKKEMVINGLLAREAEFINGKAILSKPIVLTGKTIIYNENSSPRILGIIK